MKKGKTEESYLTSKLERFNYSFYFLGQGMTYGERYLEGIHPRVFCVGLEWFPPSDEGRQLCKSVLF